MVPLLVTALLATGQETVFLPTGKAITPIGSHVEVGSYPASMIPLADGRHAVVSCMGFRQFLTVIRIGDGKVVGQVSIGGRGKEGLYYGLAQNPGTGRVYASRGAQDMISSYKVSRTGSLAPEGENLKNPAPADSPLPLHPAGIAFSSDGGLLVTANNQTGHTTDYKGSVSVLNTKTGKEQARIPVAGFPYSLSLLTKGPMKDRLALVGSERDGLVQALDIEAGKVIKSFRTGEAPAGMVLNSDQSRLYVANAHSDSISVVDTAKLKVIQTILLRPVELPGLPGATPQGLALSPDGSTLYAALSDMNAVAVVDLAKGALKGMVPTGWLPTSVVASRHELLIACAKGTQPRNPNGKDVGDKGTYGPNIIEGTVTRIPLDLVNKNLISYTKQVILNNRLRSGLNERTHKDFFDPGIEHVIYVIKENRTYDNVLGDLPKGNGDPSLCLFPRSVTPNQHALAERFVLLDNFYVCAEVSQDGWVWSTAGMVNAYASRNTNYNYSGRGRNYDTEGSNNGIPVDLIDLPDVTRPPGGYIWELCAKNKVSFRNYGFFTQFADALDKRNSALKDQVENMPSKKLLQGMTNINYRRYDLSYSDSEAYLKHGLTWPKQTLTYGANKSPSRFTEWKRDFDEFCKAGRMPALQMVRMGQNHTSGTAVGQPTPQSMVADNDYAVGQLVEAVSKSQFWEKTLICILEDDAQAGIDHVDSHRSTAFLISPWIERGTHDSRFYNTSSMLRTIELALGLPPMNQYDAVASPIAVLTKRMANSEPYQAILPAKEILAGVNSRSAYRSGDSAKISQWIEESEVDEELNDILWKSIKGRHVPTPPIKRGTLRFKGYSEDED